jgi:hypothetical protein
MALKFFVPVLASFFALSACNSNSKIGGGFELVYGGGSKISLAKEGFIIINYTVTGLGRINNNVIIENKEYYKKDCEYFLLSIQTKELVKLSTAQGRYPITTSLAAAHVKPLNQRSCST